MNVSTWNSMLNGNHLDTPVELTLHDAISYAEFEEEVNGWEIETEEI